MCTCEAFRSLIPSNVLGHLLKKVQEEPFSLPQVGMNFFICKRKFNSEIKILLQRLRRGFRVILCAKKNPMKLGMMLI